MNRGGQKNSRFFPHISEAVVKMACFFNEFKGLHELMEFGDMRPFALLGFGRHLAESLTWRGFERSFRVSK